MEAGSRALAPSHASVVLIGPLATMLGLESRVAAITGLESRRSFAAIAMACLTIVFIVFELVAHAYPH